MHQITPITEAAICPYIGKPICAVLHDGTYLLGTITDCRNGQLYLTRGFQGPGTVSTSGKKAKSQLQSKLKNKAKVSFFGFGAGAAAAAISLALIAALFTFPLGFGFPFFF